MAVFKEIWVRELDGSEYCAFTWTRGDQAGIDKAKAEAAERSIHLVHCWVGRTFPSRESWVAFHASNNS